MDLQPREGEPTTTFVNATQQAVQHCRPDKLA